MSRPILLDTCAALWMLGTGLSKQAEAEIRAATTDGSDILVSPITAWEVGLLVSKRRIALTLPPLVWFESLLEEGVTLAAMTPSVLIASSELPGPPLRDPGDKIIAATARAYGYRLMTRDRPLLDFAAAGHVNAIPC